jgi:hypothetical protein
MKVYSGTEWQNASSSIEGIKSDFVYTATASQVLFSGSDDNTNTLVIDKAGLVNVYLNGVRLTDADYTIDAAANSVTLDSGATVGDIVEIEVFGNFAGQSGADVAITGGSITGLTELSTGTFTSTGIDDNATSTAITIDSTGNVGIGTASPSSALSVATNGGVWTTSSSDGVGINYNSGNANISTYLDNSTLQIGAGVTQKNGIKIYGQTGGNRIELQVAGSERARIDSSGNLLVGTTNLTAYATSTDTGFSVFSNGTITSSTSATSAIFNTLNDGSIVQLRKDGSTVGSIGAEGGDLVIGTGSTAGLQFNDATPTIRPWNMSANTRTDGVCDLGYSNSRFKDLYLSGGVYLGGTGAANKLDSYEEGTWTPEYGGLNVTGSATYEIRTGTYTKIGNTVHVECFIKWTGHSGSAGNAVIKGLPFAISGRSTPTPYVNNYNSSTSGGQIILLGVESKYYIAKAGDNFTEDYNTPVDASGTILFQATYQTN